MDIKQSFSLKPLPLETLGDLQSLLSNPTIPNQTENKTIQLLKNCDFFRQKFRSPVDLEEFVQLAKSAATYETHNYGSILLNENDYIEKCYLLIEGQVEKIRSKPQPKNLTLAFDLSSSQIKGTAHCEGNSNRIRRSRPSVRIEESSFSHKRTSRMSLFVPADKDCSLPFIKPLGEKRGFRPSILSTSFKSPTTMNTTAELDSSESKKTLRFCDESPKSCHKSSINILNEIEKGSELDQKEQELMEFACKDDVELRSRYFYEEGLIATKVKSYHSGNFLGENSMIVTLQKSSSMLVVSSKKARFLTFSRENLNSILTILENKAQEKLETFTNIFPSLNVKFIKRFSGYFQQKYYQMNETIYFQDDNCKNLYFLCSGEVKLIKASSNQEHEIPIVTVMNGQFFGEEALLDREARQETAVANAQSTLVYVFNGDLYDSMKTSFSIFWDILTPLAQEKFTWRKAKADDLFESEKSSPRGFLTYAPIKKTFTSISRSQKLNQSTTDKRKSSSFYYRQSFLSETSPINSTEVSKISEDSPTSRVTEQYKSQFSRTIVFCKNGNEPQAVDLKKPHHNYILPALELEDLKLESEFSASVNKKKINNFSSRENSPRKGRVEKSPILIQCNSVENMQKEVKSSLFNNAKKAIIIAGRKSKKYIPTFTSMKNLHLTEGEVDLSHFQVNANEVPAKKLPTRRDTENNSVKMLIRRIKIH